jgi:hypothetical protein
MIGDVEAINVIRPDITEPRTHVMSLSFELETPQSRAGSHSALCLVLSRVWNAGSIGRKMHQDWGLLPLYNARRSFRNLGRQLWYLLLALACAAHSPGSSSRNFESLASAGCELIGRPE